jgi:protoporphyrinogen oxidase
MGKVNERKSIAVIGGGITGIVSALDLAKGGNFKVTIFEKENQLGGMSSYYKWQEITYDRFYHVVLSRDIYLLEFIKELNLEPQFYWCRANSGFYGNGKLVSFSSVTDFLRFPFLTVWQKFRLGLGIYYVSRIKNLERIGNVYAHEWLTGIFGRAIYHNFWEPLLRSKLGDAEEQTSAAFIWSIIKRLYGARSAGSKQEKMGHVRGRYHAILNAALDKLSELNVEVMINDPVVKAETTGGDKKIVLTASTGKYIFDKVLFTVPCPEILKILDNINNHPYWSNLRQVEYVGIVCVLLVLSRKLSHYYVINLLDKDLPFTGIIESTNILPEGEMLDKHCLYLPKYLMSDDPLRNLDDLEIINLFVKKLKKVFPNLRDEEISDVKVFREQFVQPFKGLNFLDRKLGFHTPIPNIFIANTSMIYDSTLNNNASIRVARQAVKAIKEEL